MTNNKQRTNVRLSDRRDDEQREKQSKMTKQLCSSENGCGETKSISHFAKNSTGKYMIICRECQAKETRLATKKNKKTPRTKTREFGIGDAAKDMFSRKLA